MANRTREIQFKIFLSDDESELLSNKIKASGKTNKSLFAREMLLNGSVIVKDYQSIKNLTYEVNRIGNNINQIAFIANSNKKIDTEEINEVLKKIEDVKRLMVEVINKQA